MTRRLRDFLNGVHFRYPLCCVLRFTFSRHDRRGGQALVRGVCPIGNPGSGRQFVPCLVFHRARYTLEEWNTAVLEHLHEDPPKG